jgi:hypothetical protein
MQPLDVGLNGPFKTYYNAAVDSWLLRNPGQTLTIYNVAECVGTAYLRAMAPENIVNAFKKCGIFPFDDCIFTEIDFMPSTVTDRPLITPSNQAEEDPDQVENITLSSEIQQIVTEDDSQDVDLQPNSVTQNSHRTPPSIQDVDLLQKTTVRQDNCSLDSNQQTPPPIIEATDVPVTLLGLGIAGEPTPSTSKKFLSPMDVLPPIKAKPRNMKRRRVPGKSMIATDTPEKDALAEKKKKLNTKQVAQAKIDLFKGTTAQKKSTKNKKKVDVIEKSDTSDDEEFIASGSTSGGEGFLSGNEDEDGQIILDGNFTLISRDPKVDEFVLVLFPYKKTFVYYVAKVLETIDDNEDESDFFVSFLRLKNRTQQTFCEPIMPDTAGIRVRDIKYILPDPKIIGSSRRQTSFSFEVHFDMSLLNLR